MSQIAYIKEYTDSIGQVYGTEDFSIFLYSLIKMRQSNTVVELGTGLGSVMLWSALALQENGSGVFYTVDDGSEWPRLRQLQDRLGTHYREDYATFINDLLKHFNFSSDVRFINSRISTSNLPDNIDILFSDFSHGPVDILTLFVDYFLKMSDNSIMMFDSASTYYSSYLLLETFVSMLNEGKMPRAFYSHSRASEISAKIARCSFSLQHMIENKSRDQNSTACLYIRPTDIFPPTNAVRF
jgi:hypothetical protein